MALKVDSVQHLTASVSGSDRQIQLPSEDSGYSIGTSTNVIFIFDDSHNSDMELCTGSADTEGLQIKANTQYQSGPWSLYNNSDQIPTYLYATGSVDCRVTVLISRN